MSLVTIYQEDSDFLSRVRPDTGIRCKFLGCKYRGSFNRKHDLERHMKKHSNVAEKCPVVHCDRFFDRYDKLLHHFRTGHEDTCEFICPKARCSKTIPFLLLRNHLSDNMFVHGSIGVEAGLKLEPGLRSCPIATCKHNKKLLSCYSLQYHLAEHPLVKRLRNTEAMLAAGYHPESLALICPVCRVQSQSYDDFAYHVEDEHIFSDRNYAQRIRDYRRTKHFWINDFWRPVLREAVIQRCLLDRDLHATKVRPHTEYAHHRLAILRLWPEFRLHPVFDEYRHQEDYHPRLVGW